MFFNYLILLNGDIMNNNTLLDKYMEKSDNKISIIFSKILISSIIILLSLIYTKYSDDNKTKFKNIFFNNFNFAYFNNIYSKISLSKSNNVIPTISTNDIYINGEDYLDGKKYNTNNDFIKAISPGIVVFKGEKDGYNKTVIVQCANGYDIWYGNLNNINVDLYEYVDNGDIISDSLDSTFLVITRNNKFISYEEYKNKI